MSSAITNTHASAGTCSLKALNVSFSYGAGQVLSDVTAELLPGRITAIVGPNGSGKSTLLLLLLGYLQPQTGKILLNETPLKEIPPRRRAAAISFVAQRPAVSFAFTVEQIVNMGVWSLRQDENEAIPSRWVNDALHVTDMTTLADRTFNELSAGEQQRVAIARALAAHTPVMLLDEPSSMLDLRHQLELFAHFQSLVRQQRKTVAWVTHDLNQARNFADHVIILHCGRVVTSGSPMEVLTPENLEPVYGVRVQLVKDILTFSKLSV